jgi:hypothetical protein
VVSSGSAKLSGATSTKRTPTNPPVHPPPGASGSTNSNSGERPRKTKDDVERQRKKLAEQVERHRRRMVLGPRLSVFQLREAQLAAMFSDDFCVNGSVGVHHARESPPPPQTAPQYPSVSGHTLLQQSAIYSTNAPQAAGSDQLGDSGRVPAKQASTLPFVNAPSAPKPNNNVAPSMTHQEQFQAILEQLTRYQHATKEYRYGQERAKHHEGYDLGGTDGTRDEDDDYFEE